MKKNLKTNALPPLLLSIACIGILAASLFIGKEKEPDFQPETPAPAASAQEWQETAAPGTPTAQPQPDPHTAGSHGKTTEGDAYTRTQPKASDTPLEIYPKVAEETDNLVTIDFTPAAEKLHPEPPEAPAAEGDISNPEEPPAYTPEEVKPEPSTAPAQPDTPAAGSSNGNGAVYDPVFGWVIPSTVNQTPMDSAGDPDKMVGNM